MPDLTGTVIDKKTKASLRLLVATLLFFFVGTPECSLKRLAIHPCTRLNRRFCIPKNLCGEPSPVNTQMNKFKLFVPEGTASLGSFSGGFSSTAGYVPGNEAQVRRRERRSTHLTDHFQRALLVFIRVTFRRGPKTLQASLSASVPGV